MGSRAWRRLGVGVMAVLGVLASGLSRPAHAWGDHYLISHRAFSNPEFAFVGEQVAAEPLEDFLAAEGDAVKQLFDDYYGWMAARGSTRFKAQTFDPANPTLAEFLRAARLHPDTTYPLVNRVLPGEEATRPIVEPAQVWGPLEAKPPLPMVFEDVTGQQVTGLSVLSTFADEPDWQMDRSLWGFTEYGYGEQPYGKAEGEGSKAPFHVQFLHENFLVKAFAPEMLEGMMLDRIELFERLSHLAFQTGHDYWGYRFTAWGTHYIQDLSQPYHAKAVPGARTAYYLRYAATPRKAWLKVRTTQLVTNRHLLYEDYVSNGLMRSYTTRELSSQALSSYLVAGRPTAEGVDGAEALMIRVADASAGHARTIDKAIKRAYSKQWTRDPEYDIERDPAYAPALSWEKVDPDGGERLLEQTGVDFESAGVASRTLLSLARAGLSPERPRLSPERPGVEPASSQE